MSKLNIDQRSIRDLLTDKRSDFLIPDYQRPYAWGEDECATLWDDLFSFAFPGDDYERFDSENDEYFLGPIVTFKNLSGHSRSLTASNASPPSCCCSARSTTSSPT